MATIPKPEIRPPDVGSLGDAQVDSLLKGAGVKKLPVSVRAGSYPLKDRTKTQQSPESNPSAPTEGWTLSGNGNGGIFSRLFLDDKGEPSRLKLALWVAGVFFIFLVVVMVITSGTPSHHKSSKEALPIDIATPIAIPAIKPISESTPDTKTGVTPSSIPPQADKDLGKASKQQDIGPSGFQKNVRSLFDTRTFKTVTMSPCDTITAKSTVQVFTKGMLAFHGCAWVKLDSVLDVSDIEGVGFSIEFPYQNIESCTNVNICIKRINELRSNPNIQDKRFLLTIRKDTGNSSYPEGFVRIL